MRVEDGKRPPQQQSDLRPLTSSIESPTPLLVLPGAPSPFDREGLSVILRFLEEDGIHMQAPFGPPRSSLFPDYLVPADKVARTGAILQAHRNALVVAGEPPKAKAEYLSEILADAGDNKADIEIALLEVRMLASPKVYRYLRIDGSLITLKDVASGFHGYLRNAPVFAEAVREAHIPLEVLSFPKNVNGNPTIDHKYILAAQHREEAHMALLDSPKLHRLIGSSIEQVFGPHENSDEDVSPNWWHFNHHNDEFPRIDGLLQELGLPSFSNQLPHARLLGPDCPVKVYGMLGKHGHVVAAKDIPALRDYLTKKVAEELSTS